MWVLIPSYEPDHRLLELVTELTRSATGEPRCRVLVVDDGSGPQYWPLFDRAERCGAVVLRHRRNLGKAAALRTGFAWLEANAPGQDVVCADSDGQHRPADIQRVADALGAHACERVMVLGVRRFAGEVPLRSRVGNRATSAIFHLTTGLPLHDTQTGLRGYPASLLPWLLGVRGERFAYELQVLLESVGAGVRVVCVDIETVYLDHNAASHFRPVVDSIRVLAPMLRFTASSALAFVVDAVALLALQAALGGLLVPVVGARLMSASVNFAVNRTLVFRGGRRSRVPGQAWRYALLAGALLGLGYAGLAVLTGLGVPLLLAKALTDGVLFVAAFHLQHTAVFAPRSTSGQREDGDDEARVRAPRAQVPRGQPQLLHEPGRGGVGHEVGGLVATAGTEPDGDPPARGEVTGQVHPCVRV